MSSRDPRPNLDRLGVPFVQVVDPNYGYDGTFTPETCYLHWTTSGTNSDTAADVVRARHYHACVSHDGTAMLGGWNVRQGHGGEGRTQPIQIARNGLMTATEIVHWQRTGQGDNTSSWPNQYGASVCLDNNGVGETPPAVQYRNWCCTAAAFLAALGLTPGHVMDHASSTNRKVDLTPVVPILDPAQWMADIATQYAVLTEGPTAVSNQCIDLDVHPSGKGVAQVTEKGYVYVNAESGSGARYHGGISDTDVIAAGHRATSITWTKSGNGYYVGTSDGNCFTFGDAVFYGCAAPDMIPG